MLPALRSLVPSWWRVLGALYIAVNLVHYLRAGPLAPDQLPSDWALWQAVGDGLNTGKLYDLPTEIPFVWSPLMAPVMAAVGATGPVPIGIAQVASVFLLRDRNLILLVLGSYGFWPGVMGGNPWTFIFVSGVLAYRGSRLSALGYLALFLLMPRPVQLPLAAWLLWRDRSLWVPFGLMLAGHSLAVLMTGYGAEWISAMAAHSQAPPFDLGFTSLFGTWWLIIAVPVAAFLFTRNRPGLAGLAVTPYVLQGYLLMPFVELRTATGEIPESRFHSESVRPVRSHLYTAPIGWARRWSR